MVIIMPMYRIFANQIICHLNHQIHFPTQRFGDCQILAMTLFANYFIILSKMGPPEEIRHGLKALVYHWLL